MKRFFKQIHLWLSVPFGILISIICFSGASLVFENEITRALHPRLYYVDRVGEKPLPLDQLLEKASQGLPDSVSITGISISSDPHRTYQANLSKPRRTSICIDPYTGEVKGKAERMPFFTKMFLLHRFLLDSMKPGDGVFVGRLVVGISTLMIVFVLLSGIVIWIPRTLKGLKNRLTISVKRGWPRFWYDLHVSAGIYVTLFLLALALTGLTWSFSWYRNAFYHAFGAQTEQAGKGNSHEAPSIQQKHPEGRKEKQKGRKPEGRQKEKGDQEGSQERPEGHRERKERPHPFAHWQEVLETMQQHNPDYDQITISKGTASISFNRFGNQRASDRYTFDTESGKITEAKLYRDTNRAGKLRGWIFSVHVGSWGGMTTRILTFIAALIGGTLPLTGYYLWAKRLYRKRKNEKK